MKMGLSVLLKLEIMHASALELHGVRLLLKLDNLTVNLMNTFLYIATRNT